MSSTTPLQSWALPRLKPIFPSSLPDEDLLEAISYTASLADSSEVGLHLKNLLGESPEALTFITEFNSRLFPSPLSSSTPTPRTASPAPSEPRPKGRGKKTKQPLNRYAQAPRLANDGQEALFANPQGVYIKKDNDLEDEYYTGSRKPTPNPEKQQQRPKASPAASVKPSPSSSSTNLVSTASYAAISKPAQGKLTSDLLATKKKAASPPTAPKPEKYVYSTSGGTPMRGATAELTDLESALRALEISTNPKLNTTRRLCPCQGLTHEVLQAAPNCLSCGKIICLKEGLGPCTFCGNPLLSSDEVQDMVRSLRDAAGTEKMAINATQNKRADVSKAPRPFSTTAAEDESLRKAQEHRDRLLGFQATSAQRTKIIDQAADFETPLAIGGLNQWATPAERALQLKRQQKAMRMMDWHAKEAYEKRKVVVAIDLKGRRMVKEMRDIEPPPGLSEDEEEEVVEYDDSLSRGGKGKEKEDPAAAGGKYAKNPLLRGLIKPVYESAKKKGKGKEVDEVMSVGGYSAKAGTWRRVQDDLDDNESVILDGGVKGRDYERSDEIACG